MQLLLLLGYRRRRRTPYLTQFNQAAVLSTTAPGERFRSGNFLSLVLNIVEVSVSLIMIL